VTAGASGTTDPPTGNIVVVDESVLKHRITMNLGDQVTLREELASGATFFWGIPVVEESNTCISFVSSATTDATSTGGASRDFTIEAKTAECRFSIMRSAADTTGTSTESQELEFIVWPTRQPEALGYLIDIDTPVPTDYTVLVGS
jgi:hypothetical protein